MLLSFFRRILNSGTEAAGNSAHSFEALEGRQLMSVSPLQQAASLDAATRAVQAFAKKVTIPVIGTPVDAVSETNLTPGQVRKILANAGSQARNGQAIVIVNREGVIQAIYATPKAVLRDIAKAAQRARTAAYFESTENAFTPRTARFIIQDHFPFPLKNTPGGPLYGVEFSNLLISDVLDSQSGGGQFGSQVPLANVGLADGDVPLGLVGDPGGIPLYIKGIPAGAIGVSGDGRDVAARPELLLKNRFNIADPDHPDQLLYDGSEEKDFDEAVAMAGATGFEAPDSIRADVIFVGGLRFPFTADDPARGKAHRTLAQLVAGGQGTLRSQTNPTQAISVANLVLPKPELFKAATFANFPGQLLRRTANESNDIISDPDRKATGPYLSAGDVRRIITNTVDTAVHTRGGIREPIGDPARVHVVVINTEGKVLGAFRMNDATRFSHDVAVQKARTALFFSDDTHAFSCRAVGFVSQKFFPVGIDSRPTGPLFKLQNALSLTASPKDPNNNPLANGITIFPGGEPLYKDGKLVGAIGVSGDGVDQDDRISFGGTFGFRPADKIRSDFLGDVAVRRHLKNKVKEILSLYNGVNGVLDSHLSDKIFERLTHSLGGVQLPYVKFPRNPDV